MITWCSFQCSNTRKTNGKNATNCIHDILFVCPDRHCNGWFNSFLTLSVVSNTSIWWTELLMPKPILHGSAQRQRQTACTENAMNCMQIRFGLFIYLTNFGRAYMWNVHVYICRSDIFCRIFDAVVVRFSPSAAKIKSIQSVQERKKWKRVSHDKRKYLSPLIFTLSSQIIKDSRCSSKSLTKEKNVRLSFCACGYVGVIKSKTNAKFQYLLKHWNCDGIHSCRHRVAGLWCLHATRRNVTENTDIWITSSTTFIGRHCE